MLASPAVKYYLLNKELFFLRDGIIYRQEEPPLLVVPVDLRKHILELAHTIPLAGHTGINRTREKLRGKYFWFGMTRDIRAYILSCSPCNHAKKNSRVARAEMQMYHAGFPMERVHLDFLGPLPTSTRGNTCILVLVDQFTKWVECIPLPDQTAKSTAEAMLEIFGRLGTPLEIFTDQGRNFESNLFHEVCRLMHIRKTRTTPYRPSANGQVERFNRTLMDAVRCFVQQKSNQWDAWLPQLTGALRSSVNRSTGFTANRLMLGREV